MQRFKTPYKQLGFALVYLIGVTSTLVADDGPALLDYEIKVDTVLKHDDGKSLWFHPRAAAMPGFGKAGQPAVVMTIQKHLLSASDYYSGINIMRTDDFGKTWSGPTLNPELDWNYEPGKETLSVCDVTPGWHAPAKKLIAIGVQLRYGADGSHLYDQPGSHAAGYAVYDPTGDRWTRFRAIEVPDVEGQFYILAPGCTQWTVKANGDVLIPAYMADPEAIKTHRHKATVLRCKFDGTTLTYVEHGDELSLDKVRGLVEPSIIEFGGRYLLTIRNDLKCYVTSSDDGLHYKPIKPWKFDDGTDLGSYNTQTHWLAHSDGLFLTYTRKAENNGHIFRHRAPLFIAQVDPANLTVIRKSERVLIPERSAQLGNFGASAINEKESWVTVSEGLFDKKSRDKGADGSTFVARVIWSKPNRLVGVK